MTAGTGVRPTKRCLDQLSISPPTVDVALSDLHDEPIPVAQGCPQRHEAGGLKRVLALKDRVWFKLKSGRWRGAVVRLTTAELQAEATQSAGRDEDPCVTTEYRWWLGVVGTREAGSRTDFYADTARSAACPVTPQKREGINTDFLLPGEWDRKRLRAEVSYAERQVYKTVMIEATARSLRSGKVIFAEFDEFSMGMVVRADRGEQFVAFIAKNVFDPTRLAVMMLCQASQPLTGPPSQVVLPIYSRNLARSSGLLRWQLRRQTGYSIWPLPPMTTGDVLVSLSSPTRTSQLEGGDHRDDHEQGEDEDGHGPAEARGHRAASGIASVGSAMTCTRGRRWLE